MDTKNFVLISNYYLFACRHAFSEGSIKQESVNDDGYETGVDHFEIRAHTQGDQGKMNQNIMDQHMQTTTQVRQTSNLAF